jgi:dipeptidyl aminopeptidase/acylaminoacyl peptidase
MPAVQHCNSKKTSFLFKHSDQDKHVDFKDLYEIVKLLKNKGYTAKLILQLGKGHAEDVNEPLEEEDRAFLNRS